MHPSEDGRADLSGNRHLATAKAILARFDQLISGPAGQPRDWAAFRTLFARHACFGRLTGEMLETMDLEAYISNAARLIADTGFWERQAVLRIAEIDGLLHCWSSYEVWQHPPAGPPYAHGHNSFQFVQDRGAWLIASVCWTRHPVM